MSRSWITAPRGWRFSSAPLRLIQPHPRSPEISSFSPDTAPNGDGHTTATTLTLSGAGEANSTIQVFDGTNSIGTAPVNSSGAWNISASNLALGSHSFTATDTDAAGNTSVKSAPLSVTIDASSPPPSGAGTGDLFGLLDNVSVVDNGAASGGGSPPPPSTIDTTAPAQPEISLFSPDTAPSGDGHTTATTLTLSGAGDSVGAIASSNDIIAFGNGAGDTANLTQGSSNNTITLGNGDGDEVNDSFGSFNTITLGNGNNTVHVGFNDTVTAGQGHDAFVFNQTTPGSIGAVTINHFDPAHDVVQFQSALAAAVTPVDDSHGNAVIAIGGGTITLADVHASALKASDFHFV